MKFYHQVRALIQWILEVWVILGYEFGDKVRCVFSMVIWPEFCMRQHRDDDHREDAPHFIKSKFMGLDGPTP